MQVQPDEPARLCGLFHVGQRKARGQPDIVEFPLRSISFDVCLVDGIAEVTQNQVYYNNTDQFMEMQFRFPVPPSACLHKFTASFADKLIAGRIKEKQQASKQYKQAVEEGRHAAYGEISEQSKDIMVIRIGNVNPKTEVKIQICYLEELKLHLNTFYCYELQTKMTPRYLNKLPKQGFINSFRKNKQTVIGEFRWDFKLCVKSTRKIISYKSPSHTLRLQDRNLESTTMNFTLQNGSLERNFSFLYTIQNFHLPTFTMGTTDASTTVMVSFIPNFCQLSVGDAERAEMQGKKMQIDMDCVMGQYIFLLDRSGSMGGHKMQSAKSALILFLKSLPVNSYFNVISFGSNQQSLFHKSLKNSTAKIKQAVEKIKGMKADLGGTEIQRPLLDIFNRPVIQGYPKQIFLLTDGEVSNTESVIELVKSNVKHCRVHTIGVGSDVSKNLIVGCAESGKGYQTFISNHQDPASKVIQLLQDSLSPVISKVQLKFDKELVESIVPNPETIPYILKNDIVNFYITFKGKLQKMTNLMLTYQDTLNNHPYTSSLSIVPSSLNVPFIDKMGYYSIIKALQAASLAGKNVSDQIYYAKAVNTKQKIIELSIKHQVLSKYTAFICQDMQLVDGRLQEIAQKGKIALNIQKYPSQQSQEQDQSDQGLYFLQNDASYNHLHQLQCYREPQMPMRASGHRGRGGSRVLERASLGSPGPRHHKKMSRKQCAVSWEMSRSRSRSRDRKRNEQCCQQSGFIQNDCKSKPAHQSSQEREDQQSKKRANSKQDQSKIEKVLAEQHAEGYWSDATILKVFLSAKQIESIPNDARRSVAITVLVLKWLREQNATGVYTLIIKKAVSWLKKQPAFAECAANYNYVISV